MKIKRMLSLVLSLIMLLGICVVGVHPAESDELPFVDVKKDWSYDAIKYVYEKGLMYGTGKGDTFSPKMNLSRGMVVTVLYRNDGSPMVDFIDLFADVKDGQYYSDAAVWAYNNGIVAGTGEDEFGSPYFSANRDITRQELAQMFTKYAEYKHVDLSQNSDDLSGYSDAGKVDGWAKNAVKWAVSVGLISGKGSGANVKLAPKDKATRAEFAQIIKNYNAKAEELPYFLVYETPKLKSQYTEPDYPLVTDADVYVSLDGDDNNSGKLDSPLRTFEAAKAKVAEIKKTKTSGEIKVAFKAGDYGTLDNIKFTSADSGNDGLKITYCAYGDGEVYFTGGLYLKKSQFKSLSETEKQMFAASAVDSIKKIDLSDSPYADKFDSSALLFNDEGFCDVARYPNANAPGNGYLSGNLVQQLPKEGHTHEELMEIAQTTGDQDLLKTVTEQKKVKALFILKMQLDKYPSLEGVKINGNISKIWHADNLTIESYDKATSIITFTESPTYGFVNYDENYANVYISGAPMDLDCDGEYLFDSDTKTLYVYKPTGTYLFSYQDKFITMDKADNIAFVNLNFRGTTDTSIYIGRCNGFAFDMGTLLYSGGSYGFEADECINVKITNSEFAYFADEGIHVSSPTSEYAVEGYHPDALVSDGLVIDNNSIHDIGIITVGVDTSGIRLSRCVKSQITHNEIYNSNRCAIRFDDCIKIDIAYNYFHHCMLNSADGGVVYSFRGLTFRDNTVRYNLFTDIPNRTGVQYAVYNDGGHAWNLYGNIFYESGSVTIVLNGGRDNKVYDNIIIGRGSFLYNSDMIDEEYSDEIKIGPDEEVNATFQNLTRKPEEGEPYYDLWRETWPLLYDFYLDFEDVDKGSQCIYYTVNYIKNNLLFDTTYSVHEGSIADKFGEIEGNLELTTDTNDYFVNPSIGDYSPKEDVSMPNNHFDMIGRY